MKSLFVLVLFLSISFPGVPESHDFSPVCEQIESLPSLVVAEAESITLDRISVYHAVESQTDKEPLITSSGYSIDTLALSEGKLKVLALSRDLLKRFSGSIRYGDVVYFDSAEPLLSGAWVVRDTMNKRYSNSADLLVPKSVKSGLWSCVRLSKWTRC